MTGPRLASSVLVSALVRRAESLGGFAAVLAKGDATAGSIVLILSRRGRKISILERVLEAGGHYVWQDTAGQSIESEQEITAFVERRRSFDPDLWVVELDIPSPERFAAEMNALD